MQKQKLYVLYLKKSDGTLKELFASTDKEEAYDRKNEESFNYNASKLVVIEELRNKTFDQIAEEGDILEAILNEGSDETQDEKIVVVEKPVTKTIVIERPQPQPQRVVIVTHEEEDEDESLARAVAKSLIENPKTTAVIAGSVAIGVAAYAGYKYYQNKKNNN